MKIYNQVMSFGVLIPLLVLQVIFWKHLISDQKRLPYFIFVLMFIVSVYFSLPQLTFQQAKELVVTNYDIDIVEIDTVPIEDQWNPYRTNSAYFFKGTTAKLEEMTIIVSPNTGNLVVVDDPLSE